MGKNCRPNSGKPWNGKLAATLKIRGGCEVDRYGRKAGKGALVQWELSATLGANQDQALIVWTEPSSVCRGGVTSQQSRGDGWNTNVCYTLNGLDIHAIAYAKRNEADCSE